MRLLILSLLILLAAGQLTYTTYTAKFTAVAPQWGTGFFTGTFDFDWTKKSMRITFDNADAYTELYVFNTDGGYNKKVLTGQFTYQYLYKTSNTCPCETNGLQYAMPPLFSNSSFNPLQNSDANTKELYWKFGGDDTTLKRADTTVKYFANPNFFTAINGANSPYYLANQYWVDKTGKPAGFTLNDFQQRTFTFTSITVQPAGSLKLDPPTTGCKCGKLLDLVLSLDRSGSISVSQWKTELEFTKNLTNSFEYGPTKTNVGVVNWNSAQWTTLPITSGDSTTNVVNTVNSMTCCGSPPATSLSASCCCCGTPIGGGLKLAADTMLSSTRTKATKVIILLTDGCQNHIWDETLNPPKAVSCGCSSEKACENSTKCNNDITKWYNYIQANIPGCKVIVIGVGTDNNICPVQLQIAAGGDPTMVYRSQSWTDLQTLVLQISATACTTNNVLCPGCCGICTCGVCYAPTKCFDLDACNKGVVPQGSQCCGSEPIPCIPPPCNSAVCDPKLGCVYTPLKCKAASTCSEWFCDNTTVVCQQRAITPVPAACTNKTVPQCEVNGDCNDRTNCTTDACVAGKCVYTPVICPNSTACSFTVCKPSVGCFTTNKSCEDGNACTIDTCDPVKGCQYKNVTCPTPKDPCQYSQCLPSVGCQNFTTTCSNLTAKNCTVPACNQTCYLKYTCYNAPPTGEESPPATTVIVASTIGTAAIVGIVVGGVLVLAGATGGTVLAVGGAAGAGGVTAVFSNPVYAGTANEGTNPIAQN